MRWFVEITPIGSGTTAETLCVEAAHWQPALQAARKLRGEADQLSGLSVEFLDDGCRAFDPALRLRYLVSKAPDDAVLDEARETPAEPAAGGEPSKPEPSKPEPSEKEPSGRASTMDSESGVAVGDGAPERSSTGRRPRPKTMALASRGAVVEAVDAAAERVDADAEAAGAEPGAKRPRPKTMAMASRGEVVAAVDAAAERADTDGEPAAPPATERVPEADVDATTTDDVPETDVEPEPPPMTQPSSSLDEPTDVDDKPPTTVDYAERSGGDGGAAVGAQEQLLEETLPSAEIKLGFHLLSSRDVQPTEESPLVYREFVYGVDAPVSLIKAEQFIRERFAVAREQLEDVAPGKVVNVALFDHVFTERPQRPPMVTLTWKDWRGDEPEIVFFPYGGAPARRSIPVGGPPEAEAAPAEIPPAAAAPRSSDATRRRSSRRQISSRREPVEPEPTPPVEPEPTPPVEPEPAPPVEPEPAPPVEPEPTPPVEPEPAPTPAPDPSPASAAASPSPSVPPAAPPEHSQPPAAPPEHSQPPAPYTPLPASADPLDRARALTPRPSAPGGPRLAGDDLLADLFEAMAELHFINEVYEGADFVLALALEKLPSEIGLVSLFDINRRQYVVIRQVGGARSGLLARLSQRAKLPQQAMRFARAVVVEDTLQAMELVDERWEQLGVVPRSLVCAPVELGGRYLGLIELANPRDGQAFQESDGHALTYIGRQFAEFVAERGVDVDPEVVLEGVEPDV